MTNWNGIDNDDVRRLDTAGLREYATWLDSDGDWDDLTHVQLLHAVMDMRDENAGWDDDDEDDDEWE